MVVVNRAVIGRRRRPHFNGSMMWAAYRKPTIIKRVINFVHDLAVGFSRRPFSCNCWRSFAIGCAPMFITNANGVLKLANPFSLRKWCF